MLKGIEVRCISSASGELKVLTGETVIKSIQAERSYNIMEDSEHQAVFGLYGISRDSLCELNMIRENSARCNDCALHPEEMENFSVRAWELLGKYIANNTHLKCLNLSKFDYGDTNMSAFFGQLTKSKSVEEVDLGYIQRDMCDVRCMVPFLENSPKLLRLHFGGNDIKTEGFELMLQALNNGSSMIKELNLNECNIKDVSALNTYPLRNLQDLELYNNNIGRDGCIAISKLLQKEGSTLTRLGLDSTGVGDEEAEILATSLKHNTKLEHLDLENNSIGERGYGAFLGLLNDISSIESTCASNHTLAELDLGDNEDLLPILREINVLCIINQLGTNTARVSRKKIIRTQLSSEKRKEYCQWQGIEYSCSNIFADFVEPNLLPNILALIGEELGQSELYAALVPTAPELMSYIDRKTKIKDLMADHMAQILALTVKLVNWTTDLL